jgi:MFS family permease
MLPLTADMAKPERRAQAIAITLSGLTLGILVARVLSGTITNYSSWRNVYWMAVGLQTGKRLARESVRPARTLINFGSDSSVTWIALYFALPDFPAKTHGVSYFQMVGCHI